MVVREGGGKGIWSKMGKCGLGRIEERVKRGSWEWGESAKEIVKI